ncbi:hypothetical protein KR222_000801 [Zaprionus bogoriensis]|nr:hypothetical protein KR222_000801 [Zaprionus bogoriensis]
MEMYKNQVFTFPSVIGCSEQEQEPHPSPHQTKRSSLNELIRQVYLINGLGHKLPKGSASTRQEQWKQVDTCLQPERVSVRSNLRRVKRQLFRAPRSNRKSTQPKRRECCEDTEAFYFKPLRSQIGRKYIRRGFLWDTRGEVLEQMLRDTLEQEMAYPPGRSVCQLILDAVESIPDMCPAVVERLTQRAKRMEAKFVNDQLRHAAQKDRFQMRESVNSMLFA